MSRRVVIQGGNAAHPFRVGSPGVNADTADLFDLFFDGNQSPLRLWGTGFVSAAPLGANNASAAQFTTGPPVLATPPGTFPVCIVNGHQSYNPNAQTDHLITPFNQTNGSRFLGYGGIVAQNTFFAINFIHEVIVQGGVAPLTNALVNYCIFKNYG